ncbi:MAG TPA: hypothetical protein VII01_05195 [Solirubrobacteraceae bacterium]
MELAPRMQQAHAALSASRADEAALVAQAVHEHQVVGVLGDAEAGKTTTIRQALAGRDTGGAVIYLNLDGAASDEHVGFMLAKQLARALLGEIDMSLLSVGVLVPGRVKAKRQQLADLLGVAGLKEALGEWPSGTYPAADALHALADLAERTEIVLWVDHVEAPRLTPRHPVKVDRLLWGVRELAQRESLLRIIVSGREGTQGDLIGPRAPFHQQGQWLTLRAPTETTWRQVASHIDAPSRTTDALTDLTHGHARTMLLALALATGGDARHRPDAEDILRELAARDDGLAARAIEHARTLHRLGGQVLTQIALAQRPYAAAQRGTAPSQEIGKVLNRLRLAGLLCHTPDGWEVLNPLVAIQLRGTVREPDRIEDWEDIDY